MEGPNPKVEFTHSQQICPLTYPDLLVSASLPHFQYKQRARDIKHFLKPPTRKTKIKGDRERKLRKNKTIKREREN